MAAPPPPFSRGHLLQPGEGFGPARGGGAPRGTRRGGGGGRVGWRGPPAAGRLRREMAAGRGRTPRGEGGARAGMAPGSSHRLSHLLAHLLSHRLSHRLSQSLSHRLSPQGIRRLQCGVPCGTSRAVSAWRCGGGHRRPREAAGWPWGRLAGGGQAGHSEGPAG